MFIVVVVVSLPFFSQRKVAPQFGSQEEEVKQKFSHCRTSNKTVNSLRSDHRDH